MMQIFRKEPFFYGHDNHDQLVKIAKVSPSLILASHISHGKKNWFGMPDKMFSYATRVLDWLVYMFYFVSKKNCCLCSF